jgi:hypothetical protein
MNILLSFFGKGLLFGQAHVVEIDIFLGIALF